MSEDLRKILAILIIAAGLMVGMTAAAGLMTGELSRVIPGGTLGTILVLSGVILWRSKLR